MSLIKCIECGSEISSFSDKCPKCGCPTKISIVGNSFKPLKEKEHRSCSGKEDYSGKWIEFDEYVNIGNFDLFDDYLNSDSTFTASFGDGYEFDEEYFRPQYRHVEMDFLLSKGNREFGLRVQAQAFGEDDGDGGYFKETGWIESAFVDKRFLVGIQQFFESLQDQSFDAFFKRIHDRYNEELDFDGDKIKVATLLDIPVHVDEGEIYLFDRLSKKDSSANYSLGSFNRSFGERLSIGVTMDKRLFVSIRNLHIQYNDYCRDEMDPEEQEYDDDTLQYCSIWSTVILEKEQQIKIKEFLDYLFKEYPLED